MKDLAKEQRLLDSVRKDLAYLNESMNSKSEQKSQKSPVSTPHVTPKRSKKSKMVSQKKIGESPSSSPSHVTVVEESCDNGARSHDHLEVDGDSAIDLEVSLETDGEDDDTFLPENVPVEHSTSSTSLHIPPSQNPSGVRRRTVGHRLMTLQAPSQERLPKHKFLRRASVDPRQNSTYLRNRLNSRQERKHSSVSWRDAKSPINSAQNRLQLPGTPEFQNAMEKDIGEIMSRVRQIKVVHRHTKVVHQHTKVVHQHTKVVHQHIKVVHQHIKVVHQHTKVVHYQGSASTYQGTYLFQITHTCLILKCKSALLSRDKMFSNLQI